MPKEKLARGAKSRIARDRVEKLTSEFFDLGLQLAVAGLLLGLSWIGQQKSQSQG